GVQTCALPISRPIGTPVSRSAAATDRTVPSPPTATTVEAPWATASNAWPVPGSARVVSHHNGAGRPRPAAMASAFFRNAGNDTFVGLTTNAGGPDFSASGWAASGAGEGSFSGAAAGFTRW